MSEQSWRNHPSNPAAQPFNIKGSKSAKKGWWTKKQGGRNDA